MGRKPKFKLTHYRTATGRRAATMPRLVATCIEEPGSQDENLRSSLCPERAEDAPLRGRVLALGPGQHSASDFVLASCFRERVAAYLGANANIREPPDVRLWDQAL